MIQGVDAYIDRNPNFMKNFHMIRTHIKLGDNFRFQKIRDERIVMLHHKFSDLIWN